jgi:hypothetical protein
MVTCGGRSGRNSDPEIATHKSPRNPADRSTAKFTDMRKLLVPRPWRPKPLIFQSHRLLNPLPLLSVRHSTSLTPKPDVPSPASKPLGGLFSDLGNAEANKPMFEQLALLTPVIIPEDPQGIIRMGDSAAKILENTALVVERRLEMMNVLLVIATEKEVDVSRDGNNVIGM